MNALLNEIEERKFIGVVRLGGVRVQAFVSASFGRCAPLEIACLSFKKDTGGERLWGNTDE